MPAAARGDGKAGVVTAFPTVAGGVAGAAGLTPAAGVCAALAAGALAAGALAAGAVGTDTVLAASAGFAPAAPFVAAAPR
ncbi:MAG: hypothetical protein ACK5Z1_00985, partial [Gemmatimonadota bacterium]